MAHGSTGFPHTLKEIDFLEKSNKNSKSSADKKRRVKLFNEEDMMIVYLRREFQFKSPYQSAIT